MGFFSKIANSVKKRVKKLGHVVKRVIPAAANLLIPGAGALLGGSGGGEVQIIEREVAVPVPRKSKRKRKGRAKKKKAPKTRRSIITPGRALAAVGVTVLVMWLVLRRRRR